MVGGGLSSSFIGLNAAGFIATGTRSMRACAIMTLMTATMQEYTRTMEAASATLITWPHICQHSSGASPC